MNIIVFVTLKLNEAEIDPDKIQEVEVNSFDIGAINEALRLKENVGARVTVAVVGPDYVESAIRKLISSEVDDAVHLVVDDAAFEKADAHTIATALGNFLHEKEFDLLLFGKQGSGLINGLPQITAEMLNLPCVTDCNDFIINDKEVECNRKTDSFREKVATSIPCLLELNSQFEGGVAKSSLFKLLKAQFKSVSVHPSPTSDPKVELVKLEDFPPRKQKVFSRDEIPDLLKVLRDEEKVL
ncbi:hypothetical protein HOK51_03515 [Candidatus Woesearchaeota archaeon]|jgi:electron transfer flavoprotein alpha/beta subunit|nr:hypothetical protein [Candidatus Woesearchaeota archaeon]MBT6518889.1 hypothetical protein [Candidatus Woesearchaeota archaeon]MBT7368491.1 hypothetical protein [Candidatus Woesearchaeota archaeon]